MIKEKSRKFLFRNDILLIAGILLIAAMAIFYLFVFRNRGDVVKVTVGGEPYATYSLREDITVDISAKDDGQHNLLVIRDGKAFVKSATCPDGICVDHSAIFRDGESIVCLPNGVVITVDSADDTDNLDVII